MRLTRKQTICDIPILKIRDYFDHIRPALISPEMISEQFDLNKEKTKELIDALLSEGYIEAAKKKGKYQLTIKGQALCVARYTNPLNKEKADKLFKEFMEMDEQRIKEAELAGKSFPSFFDQIGYTERVVLLKMKNKCRYISLHRMYDGILNITKTKQVYP